MTTEAIETQVRAFLDDGSNPTRAETMVTGWRYSIRAYGKGGWGPWCPSDKGYDTEAAALAAGYRAARDWRD